MAISQNWTIYGGFYKKPRPIEIKDKTIIYQRWFPIGTYKAAGTIEKGDWVYIAIAAGKKIHKKPKSKFRIETLPYFKMGRFSVKRGELRPHFFRLLFLEAIEENTLFQRENKGKLHNRHSRIFELTQYEEVSFEKDASFIKDFYDSIAMVLLLGGCWDIYQEYFPWFEVFSKEEVNAYRSSLDLSHYLEYCSSTMYDNWDDSRFRTYFLSEVEKSSENVFSRRLNPNLN